MVIILYQGVRLNEILVINFDRIQIRVRRLFQKNGGEMRKTKE